MLRGIICDNKTLLEVMDQFQKQYNEHQQDMEDEKDE